MGTWGRGHRSTGEWSGAAAVALVVGLTAAGCGGGSGKASSTAKPTLNTSTVATTTAPTTSTSEITTTTQPAPTTTTLPAPGAQLASVVIPPPAGFEVSHAADARNGPMSAAELNQLLSSSTAASENHYVDGYHADYASTAGPDTIEVFVGDFATAQDAQNFKSGFVPSDTAKSVNDPVIPRADDFNSTTANPDGSFDHGVIATKGNRVMFINYLNGSASAVPAVATLAQQQYAKL